MQDIPDGSVDLILTDPPYGITQCKWDSVIPFVLMWEQSKRIIKSNGAIVLTSTQPFTTSLISSNMKMFKYCWVWDKGRGAGHLNSKKQPLKNCEDVVVFYAKQCMYNPQMRTGFRPYQSTWDNSGSSECYGAQGRGHTQNNGTRYPLHKIEFGRDNSKIHPTQKPVALMEYLIKTYTNEGETVLDFAMGSGTTGIACVNTSRDFIGIELNKKYFDISVSRIELQRRLGASWDFQQ